MTYPISRNMVSLVLAQHGLPPKREQPIRVVSGSARHEWIRFEVTFSRLIPSRLPLVIDRRTGHYASEKETIAHHLARAFAEPVTDIVVVKEPLLFIAQFTVFIDSDRGQEAYRRRVERKSMAWDDFQALFS